jgi:putative cell wall-binding protein
MSTRASRQFRVLRFGVAGALSLAGLPLLMSVAQADEGFEFRRIAGDDRFETAALIRDEFGPSARVVLANGERGRFADALVASYLAGATDSPILLTRSGRMPATTKAAIQASGAERITIVGGTGSVSADQQAALTDAGYTVDRVAGPNRYATNAAVLDAVGPATSTTALVTTGADFPDALAASAVSFRTGMPLALTGRSGTSELVIDALRAAGVRDFVCSAGTRRCHRRRSRLSRTPV